MKKVLFVVFIVLPALAWGQSFESTVDFSVELSTLSDAAVVEEISDSGRYVILEGLMGDVVAVEAEAETKVWVSLMGGAWIGTDEVRSYTCKILFTGEEWLEAFPGERPRDPGPNYIPQGSRLLVVARVTGFDKDSGIPTAEMVDLRILD